MARQARTEPSLTEWAVLGLLREGSAHGWDVARAFAPDGPLGNVWTVSRPLVYRAITVLRDLGYVEDRGSTPSSSGPERVLLAPTPRGRAAFRRWLGRPVVHVRDLRSELLLKLLLLERAGLDRAPLLRAQLDELERGEHGLLQRVAASEGFDRTVAMWRLTSARAARAFVEALLDERAEEPVQYHAIGIVRSAHTELDGMPLAAGRRPHGPVADRRHRAAPRLPRRPRRVLARVGDRPPARVRRLGSGGRPVPRRSPARHVRVPLAAPAEPGLDLALHACCRRRRGGRRGRPRPPRRNARARPEAVRAALRRARRGGRRRLVRGPRRADLRAHLRRALRAAEQAPSSSVHGMGVHGMGVDDTGIELVPDPGADDPAAQAALVALGREDGGGHAAGADDWSLVPHSDAWRVAAIRDAVARGATPASGQARPVRSTRGATRA